jgi:hypothetical protein
LSASILPSSNTSPAATPPRATSPSPSSSRSIYHSPPVLRIPSDLHDHKSDLDPTEWKPKLGPRAQSEAYRYLSRFHAAMNGSADGHDDTKIDRPMYTRHNMTMTMTNTTPSLGNTPTTVASSFDSLYEMNTRPLHPRHNPLYAMSAAARSDDLVTPCIPDKDHGLDWSKKAVIKAERDGNGLGALLSSN